MEKELQNYIKDGLSINKQKDGGYRVFTIPTQHFTISSLDELNAETFERAIKKQEDYIKLEEELWKEYMKKT